METVKSVQHFLEPDIRGQSFGPPLEAQYELIQYFRLHEGVPESIRSYMNSVVSLWLYGWLYYPFYQHAILLSTTAVEMALQVRFPEKSGRGMKKLLRAAKEANLLRDEGFPSLKHRRENAEMMNEHIADAMGRTAETPPEEPFVDILIRDLPNIRNKFAHPEIHSIVLPGMTVDSLIVAAEIINQLWPAPSPD